MAEDVVTRKHVTNGVNYSSYEVELKLIVPGAYTQAAASVSCVITEGQSLTYYLYSALHSKHFLFPLLSPQDATRDTVSHSQQKHFQWNCQKL